MAERFNFDVDAAMDDIRAAGTEEEEQGWLERGARTVFGAIEKSVDKVSEVSRQSVGNPQPATTGLEGWVGRLPRNLGIGTARAALNIIDVAEDASTEVAKIHPLTLEGIDLRPSAQFPEFFQSARTFLDEAEKNNTVSDDMTQVLSQFILPFSVLLKGMGGVKSVGFMTGAARVGTADFATAGAVFDPQEARFADLIKMGREAENKFGEVMRQIAPDGSLLNQYINYMTARDEDESAFEGRFKNAVDSVSATAAIGGIFKTAAEVFRGGRKAVSALAAKPPAPAPAPAAARVPTILEVGQDGERLVRSESGFIRARERPGNVLQITDVRVEEAARGKGIGTQLYEEILVDANRSGLRLTSDTKVSPDAARVWESLSKKHNIRRNPATPDSDGNLISDNSLRPVYEFADEPESAFLRPQAGATSADRAAAEAAAGEPALVSRQAQ